DRRARKAHEPRRDRARGSGLLRLRRRDRRPRVGRAVRIPRRAGPPRGREERAGGVLSRARGSDPAAVGRHLESHSRNRQVLAVRVLCALFFALAAPVVVQSVDAIPAHIAGRFRDASGFQQSASGQYFVFDRRSHVVFGIDARKESAWEIVHIGAEPGRIVDPTAFAVAPDGTFVVADAPENRERVQVFTPAGVATTRIVVLGRGGARA